MEIQGKRSQANGPKAAKDKTEGATGDIEKWDQTGSPEISDRGRHQKSPGLPSMLGGTYVLTLNKRFLMMMMMVMMMMIMVMMMMVMMMHLMVMMMMMITMMIMMIMVMVMVYGDGDDHDHDDDDDEVDILNEGLTAFPLY